MDYKKFYLGRALEGNTDVDYDPKLLVKHVAVLGASGSGKTYFSKVLVEEAVRFGIPVIAIDSQGDLSSLGLTGEPGTTPIGIAQEYWKKVDLKVWTPGSESGIPLSLQPNLDLSVYEKREDRVRAVQAMGQELAALAGSEDEAVIAGFSKIIDYADRYDLVIETIDDVCDFLRDPPAELMAELDPIFNAKDRQKTLRSLLVKRNGPRQLLMEMGMPIDISTLFGYEPGGSADQGKTRISVISLMGLSSVEDRQISISALARALYAFMLKNPKPYPMGMLFIDESACFIPPVRKPACKEQLMLLLRQGRKYGLSVVLATQSPGDIDYIAFAQIGTRFIGRFSTNQEAYKVAPAFQGLEGGKDILDTLPRLNPGEFVMICPDLCPVPMTLKSRSLVTEHVTMTLEDVSRFVTDEDRIEYC